MQLHTITELLGEEHDLYILSLEIKNENFGLDSDEEIVLVNKIQHLREIIQLKLSTRMKQFFNDTPENFEFKLFPNPATNYIALTLKNVAKGNCTFQILDISGSVIFTKVENIEADFSKKIRFSIPIIK